MTKTHFDYGEPSGGRTLCGRPVTHLTVIEWDRVDPSRPDQCKTCIRVMDSELGGDDRD